MEDKLRVTVVGAGNLGTHLGLKLHAQGFPIEQVFSRKRAKAKSLADRCAAKSVTALKDISSNADLYLVAVPDDALPAIASELTLKEKVVAHTSGAAPSDALAEVSPFCGVLYPMQSFTRTAESPSEFVVAVNSEIETVTKILTKVATALSDNVLHLNDEQRLTMHVAAVLVNNFPNHLYAIAEGLLNEAEMSFDIMKPLLQETTRKALSESPILTQTGPAKRSDFKTIQAHLDLIKNKPALEDIYMAITESIIESEKKRS